MKVFLKFFLAFVVLYGMSTSCEKSALTVPVTVELTSSFKTVDTEYLNFYACKFRIGHIDFKGNREEGEDYIFEKDLTEAVGTINAKTYPEQAAVHTFSMPQGVYKLMDWIIQLGETNLQLELEVGDDDDSDDNNGSEDSEEDEDNKDDDGEETIGNSNGEIKIVESKGGIIFSGEYRFLEGEVLPILLIIDEEELFSIKSVNPEKEHTISIVEGAGYKAALQFDLSYAFTSISRTSLEELEISEDDDVEYIEISSDENEDLYEVLLFRLMQSVRIVVSKS